MKNKFLIIICGLCLFFMFSAQQSVVVIKGTGTSSTSAHINITSNGSGGDAYFCADSFYVQSGASLYAWDEAAICNAPTDGPGVIYLGSLKASIKVYLQGAYR